MQRVCQSLGSQSNSMIRGEKGDFSGNSNACRPIDCHRTDNRFVAALTARLVAKPAAVKNIRKPNMTTPQATTISPRAHDENRSIAGLSIGQYLIRRLHDYGVRHVFGIPGDYVLAFYKMLSESPIQPINCTREDCAGFA